MTVSELEERRKGERIGEWTFDLHSHIRILKYKTILNKVQSLAEKRRGRRMVRAGLREGVAVGCGIMTGCVGRW